jgi:hypothetical protein
MNNPVLIHSTNTSEAKAGELLIAYNWRSTAQNPVSDANKYRAVCIPEGHIYTAEVLAVPRHYRPLLVAALEEIAAQRLADYCKQHTMHVTTVSADIFRAEDLLAWNADRAALQQRLTADEVRTWAKTSATVAHITSAHGQPHADALVALLAKLAGPNHGITPEVATKLLANVIQPADTDSITGLRILTKLQGIAASTAKANDLLANILG